MNSVGVTYNLKHAIKVARVYNRIKSQLSLIRGSRAIALRKQYMIRAMNQGEFTRAEHDHWTRSQSVIAM